MRIQIASYEIDTSKFNAETAIVVCELYRHKGEWKFAAIGAGYRNGLNALCAAYGVHVSEDEQTSEIVTEKKVKSDKSKEKPKPPVATKKELLRIADSIMNIWSATNTLLRQNNMMASKALDEDPEIFDGVVYICIVYMGERMKLERNLKSELIKRLFSKSKSFTGIETTDKERLRDLLDSSFDKWNFVDVQIGSIKTDATALFCVIICAVGQLLLRAVAELSEGDAVAYEEVFEMVIRFITIKIF